MKFLFMLIFALASTGSAISAAPTPKLILNWKAEPEFGGFYAAQIDGIFKKNGVTLQIQEGGGGTPVIQMVAAGQAEFGIAAADEVVLSRERGTDIVALFVVYKTNPQAVMTHPDRGFNSMKDVFSHPGILAIQTGLPFTEFLKSKFKSSLKVKMVPYTGGIASFVADPNYSQQCFATSEPLVAKKQGLKTKTFLISDEGFNPYSVVLIARKKFVDENTSFVTNVVKSVRQGWTQYLANPSSTHAEISKLNSTMDLQTLAEIAEAQKPFILDPGQNSTQLGVMTQKRWETLASQMRDLGLIKKPLPGSSYFLSY